MDKDLAVLFAGFVVCFLGTFCALWLASHTLTLPVKIEGAIELRSYEPDNGTGEIERDLLDTTG